MSPHTRKAIEMMNAAKPASGYRPSTEAEWQKLQAAVQQMSYAYLRYIGKGHIDAQALARLMHGGAAGRMILEMSFADPGTPDRQEGHGLRQIEGGKK